MIKDPNLDTEGTDPTKDQSPAGGGSEPLQGEPEITTVDEPPPPSPSDPPTGTGGGGTS